MCSWTTVLWSTNLSALSMIRLKILALHIYIILLNITGNLRTAYAQLEGSNMVPLGGASVVLICPSGAYLELLSVDGANTAYCSGTTLSDLGPFNMENDFNVDSGGPGSAQDLRSGGTYYFNVQNHAAVEFFTSTPYNRGNEVGNYTLVTSTYVGSGGGYHNYECAYNFYIQPDGRYKIQAIANNGVYSTTSMPIYDGDDVGYWQVQADNSIWTPSDVSSSTADIFEIVLGPTSTVQQSMADADRLDLLSTFLIRNSVTGLYWRYVNGQYSPDATSTTTAAEFQIRNSTIHPGLNGLYDVGNLQYVSIPSNTSVPTGSADEVARETELLIIPTGNSTYVIWTQTNPGAYLIFDSASGTLLPTGSSPEVNTFVPYSSLASNSSSDQITATTSSTYSAFSVISPPSTELLSSQSIDYGSAVSSIVGSNTLIAIMSFTSADTNYAGESQSMPTITSLGASVTSELPMPTTIASSFSNSVSYSLMPTTLPSAFSAESSVLGIYTASDASASSSTESKFLGVYTASDASASSSAESSVLGVYKASDASASSSAESPTPTPISTQAELSTTTATTSDTTYDFIFWSSNFMSIFEYSTVVISDSDTMVNSQSSLQSSRTGMSSLTQSTSDFGFSILLPSSVPSSTTATPDPTLSWSNIYPTTSKWEQSWSSSSYSAPSSSSPTQAAEIQAIVNLKGSDAPYSDIFSFFEQVDGTVRTPYPQDFAPTNETAYLFYVGASGTRLFDAAGNVLAFNTSAANSSQTTVMFVPAVQANLDEFSTQFLYSPENSGSISVPGYVLYIDLQALLSVYPIGSIAPDNEVVVLDSLGTPAAPVCQPDENCSAYSESQSSSMSMSISLPVSSSSSYVSTSSSPILTGSPLSSSIDSTINTSPSFYNRQADSSSSFVSQYSISVTSNSDASSRSFLNTVQTSYTIVPASVSRVVGKKLSSTDLMIPTRSQGSPLASSTNLSSAMAINIRNISSNSMNWLSYSSSSAEARIAAQATHLSFISPFYSLGDLWYLSRSRSSMNSTSSGPSLHSITTTMPSVPALVITLPGSIGSMSCNNCQTATSFHTRVPSTTKVNEFDAQSSMIRVTIVQVILVEYIVPCENCTTQVITANNQPITSTSSQDETTLFVVFPASQFGATQTTATILNNLDLTRSIVIISGTDTLVVSSSYPSTSKSNLQYAITPTASTTGSYLEPYRVLAKLNHTSSFISSSRVTTIGLINFQTGTPIAMGVSAADERRNTQRITSSAPSSSAEYSIDAMSTASPAAAIGSAVIPLLQIQAQNDSSSVTTKNSLTDPTYMPAQSITSLSRAATSKVISFLAIFAGMSICLI